MTKLNDIVIWSGTLIILISFLLASFVSRTYCTRPYMKLFFLYPLISLVISINTIFNRIFYLYSYETGFFIQFLLLILDLIFWSFLFTTILKNTIDSKNIKTIFYITSLFIISLLFFSTLSNSNLHVISLINLCKTIFCIFYYRRLLKNLPTQNLILEPSFWIVAGVFFYSCLSIPLYALHDYIKLNFTLIISKNIFIISNIFIVVMHLFFIKAYICTTRLPKVS